MGRAILRIEAWVSKKQIFIIGNAYKPPMDNKKQTI